MKKKKVEELKFKSTAWPFKLDNSQTWAYWESVFSIEECQKIIDIGNKKGLIKGTTKSKDLKNYRDSNISWLFPEDDLQWAYKRLTDVILNLNERFFNFDIFGFIEGFQFTHYQEPGGKYKKHIDKTMNGLVRKLSMSVQLSNPNSYKGGEFFLYDGEEPITLPKEQGKLILFPSYILHEVKPVIKGERYSLVAWVTGPQFK